MLKPLCGKVPQWTLAFNAATLSALLYTRPFADSVPGPPATIDSNYELLNAVLDTPFVGISQIFVVDNVVSGNVIALGLLVQQPSWAFHAVGGSSVGALTGLAMGAPLDEVLHGLWGFNSALTALSVAVFYEPSPQTWARRRRRGRDRRRLRGPEDGPRGLRRARADAALLRRRDGLLPPPGTTA